MNVFAAGFKTAWTKLPPVFTQIAPFFCRNYTRNVIDSLQTFVIKGNTITFKNDCYAKIKITGTNDH